jgi:hypothetical protein
MLHANWQSFFAARADNELGSKNTSIYTKAWSSNKSDDVRIQTLISDINKVVFAADQDKHIHALHSFKVAGGTILRPTTKLMCLLGMGSSATAFIIDKQSLLNPCNLVTPTIEKLQECSKEDEGNAVNAPDDGPEDPPLSFQLLGIQTWSCPREHAAVKPAPSNSTPSTQETQATLLQQPIVQPTSSFGPGEQEKEEPPQPK